MTRLKTLYFTQFLNTIKILSHYNFYILKFTFFKIRFNHFFLLGMICTSAIWIATHAMLILTVCTTFSNIYGKYKVMICNRCKKKYSGQLSWVHTGRIKIRPRTRGTWPKWSNWYLLKNGNGSESNLRGQNNSFPKFIL